LTPAGGRWFTAPRIATENTHGTGCTLSSAIAALLPGTDSPLDAFGAAKAYIGAAIAASDRLQVGHGNGPVHHFHRLWDRLPDQGSSTA
jgi:hydroxymethylpyrimidine/phosphomethylpyrimidine kinase